MRVLTLLICLISCGVYGSSLKGFVKYNSHENTCKCDTSNEYFSDKLLKDSIQKGIENPYLLACTHHCLGVYYYYQKQDPEAIAQYKTATGIRSKHKDPLLWKSYQNLGYTYYHADYFFETINALLEAIELKNEVREKAMVNIYISRSYRQIGEYQKALDFGKTAFQYAISDKEKGHAHNNMAIIYTKIREDSLLLVGVQQAKQAIHFYENAQLKLYAADAYNNLADIFELLEKYDESVDAYQKALQIYTIQNPLEYSIIQHNIGGVFNKQQKYTAALNVLKKSLQLKEEYYHDVPYHTDFADNYKNLGDSYIGIGDYQAAVQNYNKALDNLKDNPKSESPYIYNKPDYIHILDLKAQALKLKGDTKRAAQIYQKIDSWITTLYRDLSTNTSKLVWIERAHKIYGNAIEIALMNNDKQRAFQYAEKAHAVLLWQNLSQDAALSLLAPEDREKRDDLIAQLHQAQHQYQSGKTDINTLRTCEEAQEAFEAKLEKKYPEYARRKYQTESTTVAQVKGMIDTNTAFIEYYWTDEVLQIFTITKDDFTVHTQTTADLADQIVELQALISQPNCDADCAKNVYSPLAFDLYKKLIPNEIQVNAEINRLVIVTDKAIGALPFSALTTQAHSGIFDVNYPFLLQKYATNYLYSAGSFLQFQRENISGAKGFVGFAPVEYDIADRTFPTLKKAGEEVNTIAAMHPSRQRTTYIGTDATKQNFIDALQENYQTVLLATHAQYDKQKGEIAFRGEVMNQNEIDQLNNLRIQRLMLTACETAKGKQNDGEGILSLGWNFAYKGVPSITMTHWSVNESTTMNITTAYNEALRKGTAADQALQQAQISYLGKTLHQHQPFYWAAIVHAGNPGGASTIMGIGDGLSWQWVLVFLLIGLLGYVAIRR